MNGKPNGDTYVIVFSEKNEDLSKVLAILERIDTQDISYESLWEYGVNVVRVHCGYAAFAVLAREFSQAGLIPTKFAGPKFRVDIEPERIEPQA